MAAEGWMLKVQKYIRIYPDISAFDPVRGVCVALSEKFPIKDQGVDIFGYKQGYDLLSGEGRIYPAVGPK